MSTTKLTGRENLTKYAIKQSDPDPYQIEKQDPDPYRSEKQDPDTYQKGLDPQHCKNATNKKCFTGKKFG
jgi:hypothetical protein